jgi:preprotein translocase subunit SecY
VPNDKPANHHMQSQTQITTNNRTQSIQFFSRLKTFFYKRLLSFLDQILFSSFSFFLVFFFVFSSLFAHFYALCKEKPKEISTNNRIQSTWCFSTAHKAHGASPEAFF